MVLAAVAENRKDRPLFSQSWYRVAQLRPRLRSHVRIERQRFRDREWYVLQDHSSGKFHRISAEAYFLVGLMDGSRDMNAIWDAACAQLLDDLPTQEEVITLLSQLHSFDAIQTELPPDMRDLNQRSRKEKRKKLLNYLTSPTSVRFPLFDPDRFLENTIMFIRPLMGWFGALFLMLLAGYALMLAGLHWNELTSNVTDRVLSLENLLALSLIYPCVKILHELGHAYAVKHWGGEVHEMGIMLLVFMPIPYVDATASYAFRSRRRRMMVGAAGILVELTLAAIAMVVWAKVSPGMLRAIAYNVMIIGGVSTLLMNGNPLIRYDAYYILSDYLEIPNLANRCNEYLGYLVRKWLLGVKELANPAADSRESAWFLIYGTVSFIYRTFITVVIVFYVAGRYFIFGALAALWMLTGFIILPVFRWLRGMAESGVMRRYRSRAVLVVAAAVLLVGGGLFALPLPSYTVVEGVVATPDESQVLSEADGFVERIVAVPGARVKPGELLIKCTAPRLDKELQVLSANLREVEARYLQSSVIDRTAAELVREERAKARAELERARERSRGLDIHSRAAGQFLVQQPEDLPGKYFKKGVPLAYVIDFDNAILRVVVDQDSIEQIRNRTARVEARLASSLDRIVPARVIREVPAASGELPSMALSTTGGGVIALDPAENRKPQAFRKHFIVDVNVADLPLKRIGERAYVRFVHQPETLGLRWYRKLRSLLVRKFDL